MNLCVRLMLWLLAAPLVAACGGKVVSESGPPPPDASASDSGQGDVEADRDASVPPFDASKDQGSDVLTYTPDATVYLCEDAPKKCLDPNDVCYGNSDANCIAAFCECRPDLHWTCGNTQSATCPLLPCLIPAPWSSCAEFDAGDNCVWSTMMCECTAGKTWHCEVF